MTKAQAKSLAVRYHAYQVAVDTDDWQGIIVWGPMLEEIQRQANVELSKPDDISAIVSFARSNYQEGA